ncbi:MAG TPA: hypothetical protein PKW29_05725 [Clostridia bacterium]|nr:hypothetical protein [Clostridia bacterium]
MRQSRKTLKMIIAILGTALAAALIVVAILLLGNAGKADEVLSDFIYDDAEDGLPAIRVLSGMVQYQDEAGEWVDLVTLEQLFKDYGGEIGGILPSATPGMTSPGTTVPGTTAGNTATPPVTSSPTASPAGGPTASPTPSPTQTVKPTATPTPTTKPTATPTPTTKPTPTPTQTWPSSTLTPTTPKPTTPAPATPKPTTPAPTTQPPTPSPTSGEGEDIDPSPSNSDWGGDMD